jgi:hypothetical protein
MGQDTTRNEQLTGVGNTASDWYNQLMGGQTDLEKEYIPQSQQMWNNYSAASTRNMQDYSDIMGQYSDFYSGLGGPTKFSYQNVAATNPAEQQEAYGYLREAVPGYRDFAETGGYSDQDIQELRARGVSPIRSAYGNTMMEMNRARALGGEGGAPNYIAAASKAERELPGQMADAMTTVNASLADAIRQGKEFGLSGLTGTGSTMGGLASADAARMLQAAMSNQNADLQAQSLSEQSLQNLRQSQLAALGGKTSLYGTTPGMSATFGNQALQAYQNRISLENQRNQTGLGLLGTMASAYGGQQMNASWLQQLLQGLGSGASYLGGGGSSGGGGGNTNFSGGNSNPSGYYSGGYEGGTDWSNGNYYGQSDPYYAWNNPNAGNVIWGSGLPGGEYDY